MIRTRGHAHLSGSNHRFRTQWTVSLTDINVLTLLAQNPGCTKTRTDLYLGILIGLSEHLSRPYVEVRKLRYEWRAYRRVPQPCLAHERNSVLTRRLQEHKAGSGARSLFFLTKMHILQLLDLFLPPPSGQSHSAAPFSSLQKVHTRSGGSG